MGKNVVALGELLIDFTDNGISPQGNPVMEANPGGAPCNVLAMLTKLGYQTAFIGKVGDDMFGKQLADALCEVGIGTDGLVYDKKIHTTLAFVHTFPDGDRDFSFYRNPGADMMLSEDEIDEELIRNAEIFHFGSLSMTAEPVKNATIKALKTAKEAGVTISFDPNLREPLWDSLDDAKREISFDIKMILVSMGRDGSRCYQKGRSVTVKPFLQEKTIETTGAGDTFCAGVLHYVLKQGLRDYSEDEMKDMLTFANAAASIITTRKGALRVMPSKEEVEALISERK